MMCFPLPLSPQQSGIGLREPVLISFFWQALALVAQNKKRMQQVHPPPSSQTWKPRRLNPTSNLIDVLLSAIVLYSSFAVGAQLTGSGFIGRS
jgi:hypothetical protein